MKELRVLFKYFIWQDVEKSHFLPRILNLIFAIFLSFCTLALLHGVNINIVLKTVIGIYLILNFISFWPAYYLIERKSEAASFIFIILKGTCILFSFIILLKYVFKKDILD